MWYGVWCEAKKQKDYASWEAAVYLQIGDTYYAPIDEYRMESVYPSLPPRCWMFMS